MRLHVVLGSSSGEQLRSAFAGDRVDVCRDVFTEGPCRFPEPLDMAGPGRMMRDTWFGLTERGRDVLDRRAHRVTHGGFDRWIGGTHLDAATGQLWWNIDGRLEHHPVPTG